MTQTGGTMDQGKRKGSDKGEERKREEAALRRDLSPILAVFRLIGINVDVKGMRGAEPTLEILEGVRFAPPGQYHARLGIHDDHIQEVERVMNEKRGEGGKKKPYRIRDRAITFPVSQRPQILLHDEYNSVIDVAHPLCWQPDPRKSYDVVVVWRYARNGERHGRALPLNPELLPAHEWSAPESGVPNVITEVSFYPSFRTTRTGKVLEWSAIHPSGMRIVLMDRWEAETGDPIEVALWVWRGQILAAPPVAVVEEPAIATPEGLVTRDGPPLEDDQIIWQGRVVSVWEVLAPYKVEPEMSEADIKKAKRRLLREFHPDRYTRSHQAIRTAREAVYEMLNTAFQKIEELLGRPDDEVPSEEES